ILFSSVSVENKGKLKIKGRLLDALGEPIVGATIELKEFGNPVLTVNSNPVGKFVLEAEYQKKYTLHFSQTGYYAMFIQLDTDIPIPKSDKNYTYQPYLNLISDTVESFNANVFKKPIIRVVYNNIQDYFSESQEDLAEFV